MHNFRELKVWQRAMAFTIEIYSESRNWPSDERFGLISQTRRAAISIALNIAEGSGNSSNKEFIRFLEIALRSNYEVMTALEIARSLQFLSPPRSDELLTESDEIAAMLVGFMKALALRSSTKS